MKPVAVFRHSGTEGPGYFARYLDEHGVPWTLVRIDSGDPLPPSPAQYSGLVFMGGPMSVNDDLPWIPRVLALIARAVDEDVPVLGHCLGGQLMSTQGPHTRTVRDARLALEVMAKGDPRDTRWADAPLIGPPPKRPIRVALVPEMPGGFTHPAQAAAVRTAGKHLEAAGYVVEEALPPDIEQIPDMWNIIGSNDVFRQLGPTMEKYGDEGGITSMRLWLELCPPSNDPTIVLDTLAARDYLLYRWQCFFQDTPLVIMPTLGHLPPPQDQDLTLEGQRLMLDSIRVSFVAPFLGLPGLAVPVGSHGNLRTGVQILAGRFREDLTLDAGEVIEAAEGIVAAIDPMW